MGLTVLLDTYVVVWAFASPATLSPAATPHFSVIQAAISYGHNRPAAQRVTLPG